MRNDAHDEVDPITSLSAARDRDAPYPAPELEPITRPTPHDEPEAARSRQRRRGPSTAPLWALVVALLIGLVALGWWSNQRIGALELQLVATQESFARISEDAAGRLQDISGKVVATESNVTTESEAVKLRIRQLENQVQELGRKQQAFATEQQSLDGRQGNQERRLEEQGKRMEAAASEQQAQQAALARLGETVKALGSEQATLKTSVEGQARLSAAVDALRKDVEALQQRGNPSQAISRLEQDLLVLRSELENRPAAAQGPSTGEFDAFRAQMTRHINTLQGQIANLQGQLDAR
ncbi:ATPase [Pseudomonas oligotrophica]|uniref:ATPase n=1 Tax=Pseudomonas oligotrophica TaxID=2912055 RepID=UPI001F25402C|nr:ATPase [Pseudomonas oligotrophica]MCF7201928.1 ATPase [Pseudomonas oligotrophica]